MDLSVPGQRCVSEREPELGLGVLERISAGRVEVSFPAANERRIYTRSTGVLKRVQFRPGERVSGRDGRGFVIEDVRESGGVLVYHGEGQHLAEADLADSTSLNTPLERLLSGQADSGAVFELRRRALQTRERIRSLDVRGYLGGRIELVPHQFYLLHEVAARQAPRILLADEVGLGKTIEACLIIQRLLAVGQARRILILVPESLTHQWFVELLRRFNLWFTIYDEARCQALEQSDPGANPFLSSQLALASIGFVAHVEHRGAQAVAAGWDVIVVDEAHHLTWSPENPSVEYLRVAELAARAPGLLLLTATPTQSGLAAHFARLRLLDPARYSDFGQFIADAENYAAVAASIDRLLEGRTITAADEAALAKIFNKDPARLVAHLNDVKAARPGARATLVKSLLDQHGPGRVMFRNTRATVTGFPPRQFCPVPLSASPVDPDEEPDAEEMATPGSNALFARINRELAAEESGHDSSLRYNFKQDPRLEWLVEFLRQDREKKVLVICRTQRKVIAIAAALQERTSAKVALFHEGLALVQRDRNAAWFAELDGAQVLLCSEIGSEGRNFQFAHDVVLFDLPLRPGLIEQRIGRLDRIGQTQPVQIHVPYVIGSSLEPIAQWYDRGVDAFTRPVPAGDSYEAPFRERLLALALKFDGNARWQRDLDALVVDTAKFRAELESALQRGRDRLLELHSFAPTVANQVLMRIRELDADHTLPRFLFDLLDHFGVRVKEHEEGDVFLDPSHAYIEAFPGISREGMLATFDRRRAIAREDIRFLSADHAMIHDAIDLLLNSPAGSTSFGLTRGKSADLLLDVIYVLEPLADRQWNLDAYLAPTPIRVVANLRGENVAAEFETTTLVEGDLHRFLETPGFSATRLKALNEVAQSLAQEEAERLRNRAAERAHGALTAELQRLVDLKRINDHVRGIEIDRARERREYTADAIKRAPLRLDSVRLILQSPGNLEALAKRP